MQALSSDLRARLLSAVLDQGDRPASVARRFAVSESALSTLLARARGEGRAAALRPRLPPGAAPKLAAAGRAALAAQVASLPDATLAELQTFLSAEHRVALSLGRLSQVLAELGLPRKKRVSPPRSATRRRALAGGRSAPPKPSTLPGSSSSTSAVLAAP